MILKEIINKNNFEIAYLADENKNIESGYSCDLLSEVIGRAKANSIWITVHTNLNVLAVASMIDISAVIIAEGHELSEDFIKRAKEEEITVLLSDEDSYSIAGKLYEIGVR